MRHLLAFSIVIAALLLTSFNLQSEQKPVAVPDREPVGQAGGRHMRWEYAEFTWKGSRFRLETPETVIETDNMPAMLEKVGSTSKQVHSTAILNALGSQGWELVSHQTFL